MRYKAAMFTVPAEDLSDEALAAKAATWVATKLQLPTWRMMPDGRWQLKLQYGNRAVFVSVGKAE